MTDKKNIPYFILNPTSGGGKTLKLWPEMAEKIRFVLGNYESVFTRKSGDATTQTLQAIDQGYRWIIAVGGDGTVHEVMNGILQAQAQKVVGLAMGIFPLGTGNDFVKSISWPKDPLKSLERLKEKNLKRIDVGKITYQNHRHKKESRYFTNIADFGLGGRVMQKVNASSKTFGSKPTYLYHVVESLFTYKPSAVVIESEERNCHFSQVVLGIVANGKYFGSGFCVAPEASLEDGCFDVLMVEKLGVTDFFKVLPKLYKGEKIEHPSIFRFKSSKFFVRPVSTEPIYLDVDGEQPGMLEAEFELLPKSLSIVV